MGGYRNKTPDHAPLLGGIVEGATVYTSTIKDLDRDPWRLFSAETRVSPVTRACGSVHGCPSGHGRRMAGHGRCPKLS